MNDPTRRTFLSTWSGAAAGLLLAGCRKDIASGDSSPATAPSNEKGGEARDAAPKEIEVTAAEDLMREHGVLRRALIVYREAAAKLRATASSVPPDALQKTAKLFRAFGEDYHEKKLEEQFIFPAVKRAGGLAATHVDVLLVQHQRGRAITDYILAVSQGPKIGTNAGQLARVLEEFARMYEAHTAREDTIVFPAWKATMSEQQYDEVGDKFEDIEHEQFGKDGFEDAVAQIASIEASLGLGELAFFTAPVPPKA